MNYDLLTEKHFNVSVHLMEEVLKQNCSLEEFILLIYFEDAIDKSFNVSLIEKATKMSESTILTVFNNLMSKKLITILSNKDIEGKRSEEVSLRPLYESILETKETLIKEETKIDIYASFETEFGRAISSMEYEIIGAWIEKGFKEELILGALKEAVYNGVTSLRYIDKILYEWQKKGYKCMNDIKNNFLVKEEKNAPELFDYNWLDDNE